MKKKFNDMYVGGRWWPIAATFADLNPSDGSVWAEVPDVGINEVRNAIDSANHGFEKWSELPFNQRAHYMFKIAEIFQNRKMDIVSALQGEAGGWFGKGILRPWRPSKRQNWPTELDEMQRL